MSTRTFAERLAAGLTVKGWRETFDYPSRRYRCFRNAHTDSIIFVGPNGALRIGRTMTTSRSIGEPSRQTQLYAELLKLGDARLGLVITGGLQQLIGTPKG